MRTALLAALEHGEDGTLRASLLLGGRSVLAWQGEAVRALGCERVICLTERFGEDILALQRAIEAGGGEFHAVRSGLQLPGLIRAEDELVILLDGLVTDRAALEAVACEGGALRKGVATLPASHPLAQAHPAAFERIDRERSWAGVTVMRAAPVQQLSELPGDAPVSLLLRLALQSGTPCRELGVETPGEGEWLLATSQAALAARERGLVDRNLREAPWTGPGRALAQDIARRMAPRGLVGGPLLAATAAMLLMLAGAVLCAIGLALAGLALAALGAFAGAWSDAAARLARGLLGEERRPFSATHFGVGVDLAAGAALLLAMAVGQAGAPGDLASAALGPFAIGLTRLAARVSGPLAGAFWRDRSLQLAALALAAGFSLLGPSLALLGLAALAQLLLQPLRD